MIEVATDSILTLQRHAKLLCFKATLPFEKLTVEDVSDSTLIWISSNISCVQPRRGSCFRAWQRQFGRLGMAGDAAKDLRNSDFEDGRVLRRYPLVKKKV